MKKTIHPSSEQLEALDKVPTDVPVVMVNLLKFKDERDEESGRMAYARYAEKAIPYISKVGGKLIWRGQPQMALIAPEEETLWDEMLLVSYPNVLSFRDMIQLPGYPHHLRASALEDSRLIVCTGS
ncbi:MAG: hypothetical protein R3350_07010 [Saprospiraceae bacterium]|nr:hypothetical protein [Saprospiraceae bacterium]